MPLTEAELAHVLAGYGLPPEHGARPRVVTARVLHLSSPGDGLAIKVFPRAQHAEAHTEAALLAHLQADDHGGYRVQPLLCTTTGEPLSSLGERRVLVTRWVPGVHRSYRAIDPEGWAALGRTLAALHLRLDEAGHLPLRRLADELRGRELDDDRRLLAAHRQRAAASHRPGAELVGRILADRAVLLERHATRCRALLPTDGDDRPIHNDYNVHNYLFHEHGPPTILDWERAIHAPREFEVCRCLNHLPLVAPASAWALVGGYLQRRALDPDRIAWAIDASVGAHARKHWPIEAWLRGEPGAVERLPGLAEIVRSFVEGRSRLDAFVEELRAKVRERRSPR